MESRPLHSLLLMIMGLLVLVGCSITPQKNNLQPVDSMSLVSEWNQIKKEMKQDSNNQLIVNLSISTMPGGNVTLSTWQWMEPPLENGYRKVYFAEKLAGKYKITGGDQVYLTPEPPAIPVETIVRSIDEYGLRNIFKEHEGSRLDLMPTKDIGFFTKDHISVLVKNGKEIDQSNLEKGKQYIRGFYGINGSGREYLFSLP